MKRLLQGDVGSGKTVVAAVAIYAAYISGYQVIEGAFLQTAFYIHNVIL